MSIDTVRISEKAKRQLITVKQRTGIEHWNILCRWALCLSLADDTPPPPAMIPLDSNVEMTWCTFGGEQHELYLALIKHRSNLDGKTDFVMQFKLHLHRGIGMLSSLRVID